jgi:cysteine sulfinate desulfinase/cysteine desulfurase-like protein
MARNAATTRCGSPVRFQSGQAAGSAHSNFDAFVRRPAQHQFDVVVALRDLLVRFGTARRNPLRVTGLRDNLWERLESVVPGIQLNGHRTLRLPNTFNVRD